MGKWQDFVKFARPLDEVWDCTGRSVRKLPELLTGRVLPDRLHRRRLWLTAREPTRPKRRARPGHAERRRGLKRRIETRIGSVGRSM